MPEEAKTIAESYGLKRDNFILDPLVDYDCFARDDIPVSEIAAALDIDLVTGLVPKRLVWGPYGGGKTHMLMKTASELQKLTAIYYVRIECPDLAKKSRFHDLFREGIMRGIGQDFVIGLLEESVQGVVKKVGFNREALRSSLKELWGDEEVARAAEQLLNPNFDRLKLWRWLAATPMSRSDLNELGQTQDLTQAEAARLADIVVLIGRCLKLLRKQTLVLILDEMERLVNIGSESLTTFISGFSHLVDQNQKSVSILIGSSAELEHDMIELFGSDSPVMSRLGEEVKIMIPALEVPDIDRFVLTVIAFLKNPEFDLAAAIAKVAGETTEETTAELYPFTAEAVEALKSRLTKLTPRAITMQMTTAIGRAYRNGFPAITSACFT